MPRLEPNADRQRAKILPRGLRFELFGAPHIRVRKPPIARADRKSSLEVRDIRIAVDRGAILERVAIEEEVVRHRAALNAGEHLPRQLAAREMLDTCK